LLESTAVTAAAGVVSLIGQVFFVLEAVSLWIEAWSESDKKVAILGSCAGVVATALGEDAPQPPQGRWLGTPQDRDRWAGVWWENARAAREWVHDTLDRERYRQQALRRAFGTADARQLQALMHMLPGRAVQAFEASVASAYEEQLPGVLALLLKARQSPAETLNALYQPLAREHLAFGPGSERFTWPP